MNFSPFHIEQRHIHFPRRVPRYSTYSYPVTLFLLRSEHKSLIPTQIIVIHILPYPSQTSALCIGQPSAYLPPSVIS